MKNKLTKVISLMFFTTIMVTGCSSESNDRESSVNGGSPVKASTEGNAANSGVNSRNNSSENVSASGSSQNETSSDNFTGEQSKADTLNVAFGGDRNKNFTLHLYDNSTAAAIAKHVGTASWQLPIYHYDDYDNWEVMQYYDVPSRYEIPSNAENITSEKAGEVYYSEPNRIVLFFGDANVSGEYTKVGCFDFNDELKSAIENNPVVEGWGNKLVFIRPGDLS